MLLIVVVVIISFLNVSVCEYMLSVNVWVLVLLVGGGVTTGMACRTLGSSRISVTQ